MKITDKLRRTIIDAREAGRNPVWIFIPKSMAQRLKEYAIPSEIRRRIISKWSLGFSDSGTFKVYCPASFYGDTPWFLPAPYRNYKTKPIKKI